MANLFTKLTLLILISAIVIGVYQKLQSDASTKRVVEYGQQNEIKIDKSAIKREDFKIKYDEAEWKALQSKLDSSRYFSRLETVPTYEFGFNPEYAKDLVTYWSKSFDWKKQINKLNKYQQYRITINNTIVHYIYHETNKGKSSNPAFNLMLIDGWPGCSFSFLEMIDKIEKEFKDLSFRIFVPSIPGYGYSTPLNHPVDYADTAFLFDALMRYENAEEYFVHGEDWGSFVTTALAQLFPNRVRGIHITLASFAPEFSSLYNFGSYVFGQLFPSTFYTKQEIENHFPQRYALSSRLAMLWHGFGYFHIQATKPDTLGHSFADSPVGLMAYILEKYSAGSFDYQTLVLGTHDGGLEKYSKDELLSIITIYWMSNCMTSAIRFYKNNMDRMYASTEIKKEIRTAVLPTQVAVGIQQMLIEVFFPPARVVQMRYPNLVQYNIVNGGHFAAFQKPLETAKNFVQFVLKSL